MSDSVPPKKDEPTKATEAKSGTSKNRDKPTKPAGASESAEESKPTSKKPGSTGFWWHDPFRSNVSDLRARVFNAALVDSLLKVSDLAGPSMRLLSPDPQVQTLKKEILDLQNAVSKQAGDLKTEIADKTAKERQLKQLNETLTELQKKQDLDFLLSRVSARGEKAILTLPELKEKFFSDVEQPSFVVSIDIRRSTELMLKARSPGMFAAFMTQLCSELEIAIKEEFGVFDKFTGDGVLAFFPEFFSGIDAGYHAIMAAKKALAIFADCYRQNRPSFTTILRDVNLSVGIDYGGVHLVQVAGGLTVVGSPVVYACRLSGGPAGSILLNQPAYEKISDAYGSLCLISETEIEIKHEGGVVCYDLKLSNKSYVPAAPAWITTLKDSDKDAVQAAAPEA